jgi:hypothetical protein
MKFDKVEPVRFGAARVLVVVDVVRFHVVGDYATQTKKKRSRQIIFVLCLHCGGAI